VAEAVAKETAMPPAFANGRDVTDPGHFDAWWDKQQQQPTTTINNQQSINN
jgi:hypothetical protein